MTLIVILELSWRTFEFWYYKTKFLPLNQQLKCI